MDVILLTAVVTAIATILSKPLEKIGENSGDPDFYQAWHQHNFATRAMRIKMPQRGKFKLIKFHF
jgi:hypothetical protein